MKKTYAQFAGIFVGVLVMHLVVATALMKSAETDDPKSRVTSVDPTYHRSPASRGPAPATSERTKPARQPESTIPDAFAENNAGEENTGPENVPPPPLPETQPDAETPSAKTETEPESPTRRLTVNQLLAGESGPKVKPLDAPENPEPTEDSPTPRVQPLTPVKEAPESGPRTIRSLNGD